MEFEVNETEGKCEAYDLEDIKNIIREEIEKRKSSLNQITCYLQEAINVNLSTIDCAYIEHKYIKYCSKLWLQEVTNFLIRVREDNVKQRDVAQEVISQISAIQNINQIPTCLGKLQYYDILLKHRRLIDRERERIILVNLKERCLEQLIGHNDIARKELDFLRALKEFLNSSETPEVITRKFFLLEFHKGDISFDELLQIIINMGAETYDEEHMALRDAAKLLKGQEHFFLLNEIKEIIEGYIMPVKILKKQLNNRSFIEIKGRIININEVLVELESHLQNTKDDIDEVHFVGSDSVHIRVSLQKDVWHGMNIVIYTNVIKVYDVVTWDISGKDVSNEYSDNAGTDTNGDGLNGVDGYAGGSGGNVKIFAKSIENPEKWTIVSNGGGGGKGQDGGNGKDGLDGEGIQTLTFCKEFPSIIFFACNRGKREEILNATVNFIKSLGTLSTNWRSDNNVFIKVVTDQGNEITFSYCTGTFTTRYQAFLLYAGSLGKSGGKGGECGLGGQGGYPGEIDVCSSDVKVEAKSGQNGNKGKGGLYGNYGKNGWDMAYIDYQNWNNTIFYGKDMKSKLTIDYYTADNADGTRIWCPYYDKYAEIKAIPINHKKQKMYEERQESKSNGTLGKHALPVRKNAIISASFTTYLEYCNRVDDILQSLKFNLEQTESDVLQVMCENEMERKKQEINIVVNTRRCVVSTCLNENKKPLNQFPMKVMKMFKRAHRESKGTLIETLRSSNTFKDWVAIKNRSVPYSDLEQLFVTFGKIKNKGKDNISQKHIIQCIEEILISKYKFSVLQKIATELPPYQTSSKIKDQRLLPVNMAKYLILTKEINNKISHNILGTLNQYIFDDGKEQRQKICKYLKEHLHNENYEILKHSIIAFILESKEAGTIIPDVEKYRKKYLGYLQKKSHNVNESLKAITKEVERHNRLYDLWIECITDKSKEHVLEARMKEDKFLFALYCRFKDQFKEEFNWSICYTNKRILDEHDRHLREFGSMSTSYRELLAHLFDINIKIYRRDEKSRFLLLHNHNKSSERSIYILQRNNKYMALEIDEDYLRLNEERKWKNNLYAQILKNIESFTQKEELDEYLKCQAFLYSPTVHNGTLKWPLYDGEDPNEEDVYIDKILSYFSEETEKRSRVRQRLEKLMYQYVGQRGYLYCIAQSFANEGRHISTQVLYYLINSILNNVIQSEEEQEELFIFHWIITSHSQRYWLIELTLLQLENYFKKSLTMEQLKWRERLLKIDEDILMLLKVKLDREKSVSVQCIDDILHLLSSIPNEAGILKDLGHLGLCEWPYSLKEEYWAFKLSKLVNWKENDELLTASYYVLSVENSFGTVVVEQLLEIMQVKNQKFTSKDLIHILCNFHNESWQLNDNVLSSFCMNKFADWVKIMEDKVKLTECFDERNIVQLIPLIEGNSNTSSTISDILPKIKEYILDRNASIGYAISIGKSVYEFTENDIEKWVKSLKNDLKDSDTSPKNIKCYIEGRYAEMLAVIDRAIELKKGFKLRDTQKLSVLTLLMNKNNTLEQISTGEGKSLIVVVVSIVKALCGEKVDIITSSSVLAKRDTEENKSIYKLFDIAVSHNCDEITEKRKGAYSNNRIVYGDLSSFQRDYLLDRFYKKNILGNRTFDNIIVDEVDSMLLDKGNNMLYLSHDLAGLDKAESIYIFIWQLVNKPSGSFEDFRYAFDPKMIKETILYDLYGLVVEEDIKRVDDSLTKEETAVLWSCLVDANVLDNRGRLLLKENVTLDQIEKILPPRFGCYVAGIHYLINETINRERFINVPNYLKTFIEEHLEAWINSARIASLMQERYDYIIDIDRSGTSCDRYPQIIILDRDTGTDQINSQWDEALHQFLQLKHGCKLSLQSLKAVFVSNVSYLKLYSNLYGLSGTLGLHGERGLLEDIYKVDFVIVPTAKPKQFYEMKPIICNSKEKWINEICKTANKLTIEKLRSVLIICETVKDVEKLYVAFGGKAAANVHTYVRDYEEFNIAKGDKEMEQKQIIIATNLAGRGTDIKITQALSEAGGLHVCLTYLPSNTRVEQQAFGRAARSGNRGSGQLIIISAEEKEIFRLKKQRDVEELYRISRIKDHYERQTLVEENYFNRFKEQYVMLDKHLDESKVCNVLKNILLESCLDEWAFWLDRNSKHIRNTMEERKKEILDDSIDRFIEELQSKCNKEDDWSAWVKDNPCHMLKLGVYLAQKKTYDKAMDLFDKIIKREPDFSIEAHYYKAFAVAKNIDWTKRDGHEQEIKEFEELLRKVLKCLNSGQDIRTCAASIIHKINSSNNEGIIKIDAYAVQQKNINEVTSIFSKTIDDIFGHPVISQHFVGHNIDETLAITLYENIIEMGILERPKVAKNISKVAVNKISHDYDVPFEKLSAFLDIFQGKDINERSFIKELKESIVLPSRETFWKLLIKEGALTDEFIYVLLNKEILKICDPSSLNKLLEGEINDKSEDSLIRSDFKQVFLYAEQINVDKGRIVLEKDHIKRTLGEDKYRILKKKGTFPSSNKVARVNIEKIQSIIFPQYDSITINDFKKINITTKEAEKILAELVCKGVLTSGDTNNSIYRLIAPYASIRQLELSFRPVYERNVKVLLSVCFAYRIALQRMIEDLTQDDNQFLRLKLLAKPYKDLFCSLTDEGIVEPAKVAAKCENAESELRKRYCKKISKTDIIRIFEQSKLIPFKICNAALCNELIEKKWILECSFFKDGSLTLTDMYSINDSRGARKPLDLIYRDVEETLHVIMDNMARLSEDETIAYVVLSLRQLRSSLKTLDYPDPHLKPLLETDVKDFANVEEIRVFILNGFDQLLTLEEKKWTRKMLFYTGMVIAIGICQITIGVLIELYSAGAMTHVGKAFISEGISDIMFATSALTSGYFSWKDYRQHKIQSLIITVTTLGIGIYFSRGVKLSHFGHKVAGTSLELGERNISEIAGKQLFQTMAKSTTNIVKVSLTKEVIKRITLKTIEGIAFGLTNASIDLLVEKYQNSFCDSITFTILSHIEETVAGHRISSTLKESYKVLGKEGAHKMINDLTKVMFKEKDYMGKLLSLANQISTNIVQGIMQGANKMSKANKNTGNCMLLINNISKICTWTERAVHVGRIVLITHDYLDKMENKVRQQLNYKKSVNFKEETGVTDKELEAFEREIIDRLKLLLREKATQIIMQQIVVPIIKGFAKKLVGYLGKMIKVTYRNYEEGKYYEEFQKLRRDYKNKLRDISEQDDNDSKNAFKEQITDEYDNSLIRLMAKTRNPLLFAAIVEEGVPMESICLKSCVKVIPIVLKKKGIILKPFTLNVEGENGVRESISSQEKTNGRCVNLKLEGNHFTLCESDSSNTNESNMKVNDSENDGSRNNCLFEALRRNIPELNNLTGQEFRKHIADYIRNDPGVKYFLNQAWHRLPLAFNLHGGDRRETKTITSSELRKKIQNRTFKFSQSSVATHTKEDRLHVGELSENIKVNKWKGEPVRVVETSKENYVTLDHRRVLAVAIADDPNVEMEIAIYDPDDEFSTEDNNEPQQVGDIGTNKKYEKTAGGLLKKRMRSGSLEYLNTIDGFDIDKVKIRLCKSDYEYAKEAEKRLEKLGCQMGGPRRNKNRNGRDVRSKSVTR